MLDINKVFILENKEEYLVLDKVIKNGIEYFYVAKVNEKETDIENNFKLITVIQKGSNNVIEEVIGEDRLREILPLFAKEL